MSNTPEHETVSPVLKLNCAFNLPLQALTAALRLQEADKEDTVHYKLQKTMNLITLPHEKSVTFQAGKGRGHRMP